MASPRILKQWVPAGEAYELVPRASRYDREQAVALLREAQARAEAIVTDAESRAAAICWEAEQERERQMETLQATLLAQARQEAHAQLAAEMDQTFVQFGELVQHAVITEADLRRASQAELLALAVGIAEQIIASELTIDPLIVTRTVEMALTHTQSAPITQIMVHPDDLPIVQRWAGTVLAETAPHLELVGDSSVGRGGCVIGTKTGFVDARVETRLAEIRQALAEAIEDA